MAQSSTQKNSRVRSNFQMTPLKVILLANVLLILFLQFVIGQNLLDPRTLSTLTPLLGIMVIVGLAQAFVIGTGGIDLSLPHVVTLMGIVILKESEGLNEKLPWAIFVAFAVCLIIGLVNGILVEYLGFNALVTTLATGQVVLGATIIYRGTSLSTTRVPEALSSWSRDSVFTFSFILIAALILVLIVAFAVLRLKYGRRLVLSSASVQASHLIGIRHLSYRVGAWVIAAIIAGVGGILLAGQIMSPDMSSGAPYLLSSIVVVVLGGAVLTGGRVSPIGALFGAFFIILLGHGLAVMGYSAGVRTLAEGLVLALGLAGMGLLMRPRASKTSRDTPVAEKKEEQETESLTPSG